jgi:hypothetical protein
MRQKVFRLICDRCKAVSETEETGYRESFSSPDDFQFPSPSVPEAPREWTAVRHQGREKDLCPECSTLLDNFMTKPESLFDTPEDRMSNDPLFRKRNDGDNITGA